MKEGGDVFRKFRNSFERMDGHFHILEQRVPVELQIEYFKHSEDERKRNRPQRPLSDQECQDAYYLLTEIEGSLRDTKRNLLTTLATSKNVKAYSLLKQYVENPDVDVTDWAFMALMECRISLESELSDEKQIYISTGLGGKSEKLRFYILILSAGRKVFVDYQRKVIEREFAYLLPKADCEIERLTIGDQYTDLLLLIPVRSDIKGIIDKVINECNQYGNFLSDVFTITNVKELTHAEIEEIINKDGNSKASD